MSVGPDTKANRRGGFRELRALDRNEIRFFLDRHWWGVLSTVEEPYPYAVPVVYGYDGEYFYVANKSGRKVSNIEANRSVCLCVADVQQGPGDWSSVVATGDAEFIASGDGRLEALRALRRQMGYEIDVGPRDLARIAAALVIRIVPHEITGRTTAER